MNRAALASALLFLGLAIAGPPAGLISETMGWGAGPAVVVSGLGEGAPPTVRLSSGSTELPSGAPTVQADGRWALGPLAVVRRDLRPTWTIEVGGAALPWMVNAYTSALPELPGRVLTVALGPLAGVALHLLLGALLVGGAAALAGRLAGPLGAWATGLWLATDPFLLLQSRILGPHTPVLALLMLAGLVLLERRRDGEAGVVLGLGLAAKATFAAPLAALALGLAIARRPRWTLGAGLLVGVLPSASAVVLEAADVVPAPADRMPGLDRLDRRRALPRGGAVDAKNSPKRAGATAWALSPNRWWRSYLLRKKAPNPEVLDGLTAASAGLLLLLGAWGLARRDRLGGEEPDAPLATAVVLAGLAAVPAIRAMHPDTHHLPLATPVFALALGIGLARVPRGPAVAALVAATLLRGGSFVDLRDPLLDGNWRNHEPTQRAVVQALQAAEAEGVAYIDYGLYQLLEGYAPELQPVYWGHLSALGNVRGPECFLRLNAGGHVLLMADGPPSSPAAFLGRALNGGTVVSTAARAGIAQVDVQAIGSPPVAWLVELGEAQGWSACAPLTPTRPGSRPGRGRAP